VQVHAKEARPRTSRRSALADVSAQSRSCHRRLRFLCGGHGVLSRSIHLCDHRARLTPSSPLECDVESDGNSARGESICRRRVPARLSTPHSRPGGIGAANAWRARNRVKLGFFRFPWKGRQRSNTAENFVRRLTTIDYNFVSARFRSFLPRWKFPGKYHGK
jgi:hypothetical protein